MCASDAFVMYARHDVRLHAARTGTVDDARSVFPDALYTVFKKFTTQDWGFHFRVTARHEHTRPPCFPLAWT